MTTPMGRYYHMITPMDRYYRRYGGGVAPLGTPFKTHQNFGELLNRLCYHVWMIGTPFKTHQNFDELVNRRCYHGHGGYPGVPSHIPSPRAQEADLG